MGLLQNARSQLSIASELLGYLWRRKLWWMIPVVTVLVLFGILLVFAQSSVWAPFIYPLF